jgi:hypothetical protein
MMRLGIIDALNKRAGESDLAALLEAQPQIPTQAITSYERKVRQQAMRPNHLRRPAGRGLFNFATTLMERSPWQSISPRL